MELNQYRNNIDSIGREIILPSSFNGSPRNMYQNYLDAMSIVQHFGNFFSFVTMTFNPYWPEIMCNIDSTDISNFRSEIIFRVFKCKLKELMNAITTKDIFGKVEAIICTIILQKRGLPHAHILITLTENDKLVGVNNIDRVVCAEIPNIRTNRKLHEYVIKHMMHGPWRILNLGEFLTKKVCYIQTSFTNPHYYLQFSFNLLKSI